MSPVSTVDPTPGEPKPEKVERSTEPLTAFSTGFFLLRATSSELRLQVTHEGEAAQVQGEPELTVLRGNGELLTEGKAKRDGADLTYVLSPEETAHLDLLETTWSVQVAGATQTFVTHNEIVGGFLVSAGAIEAALPNGATPTQQEILEARELAERWLEDECNVAFRPRYARETLDGTDAPTLCLGHPRLIALRELSVGGEAVEVESVQLSKGSASIWRAAGWSAEPDSIVVAYEHGFSVTPPQVSRAALRLARHFLVKDPSDYDERASSMSTDEAHYTFITPGMRGANTSIPEVNVVIEAFEYREGIA